MKLKLDLRDTIQTLTIRDENYTYDAMETSVMESNNKYLDELSKCDDREVRKIYDLQMTFIKDCLGEDQFTKLTQTDINTVNANLIATAILTQIREASEANSIDSIFAELGIEKK